MKLPHISVPKHFSKLFWIALGIGIITAAVLIGAAEQYKQNQHNKQAVLQAAQTALQQKQQVQAFNTKITALHGAMQAEQAKVDQLCAYVQQLDGNKTITKYITVPQVCVSNI